MTGSGTGPAAAPGGGRSRVSATLALRVLRYSPLAVAAAMAIDIVLDWLNRSLIGDLGVPKPLIVVLGLFAELFKRLLWPTHRDSTPQTTLPTPPRREPLPPPVELFGRDKLVDAVVAQAQGCVLVRGPNGIGASAVAIEAARKLVDDPAKQRYVDLMRGRRRSHPDGERQVITRVLTALGTSPGRFPRPADAAEQVRELLNGTGCVLVLDNITEPGQVEWISHQPLHEAHLVLAGDISGLADVATVAVGPLGRESALRLLRLHHPTERADLDSAAAGELAERYLRHPRTAIDVGRWLAANPQVTVSALLTELDEHPLVPPLRIVLDRMLDGTSARARELLAVLNQQPVAELPAQAVAALCGLSVQRTTVLLEELIQHWLVERTPDLSRYRTRDEAAALGEVSEPALRRAVLGLLRYYAVLATEYAEVLAGSGSREEQAEARDWFSTEDTALLELVRINDPPGRAGEHLWRIADALDAWYTSENRLADRVQVARTMHAAAERLHDPVAEETALLRLAAVARLSGGLTTAGEHMDAAERLHEPAARHDRGRAVFHTNLGVHKFEFGQLDPAHDEFERSLARRARKDELGRAIDLTNLGAVLLARRQFGPARDSLLGALARAERIGDLAGQAHAREQLGLVAYHQHDHDGARRQWRHAGELFEQCGDGPGQARCLLHTGTAVLVDARASRTECAEAVGSLLTSLRMRGSQTGVGVALTHLYLGLAAKRFDNPEDVARHRGDGLAALDEWDGRADVPPAVTEVRGQLDALGDAPEPEPEPDSDSDSGPDSAADSEPTPDSKPKADPKPKPNAKPEPDPDPDPGQSEG